jgi:hypothetical protein
MITVGIHSNLRPYKATKNDRGTLVIGFKEEVGAGTDLLGLINSTAPSTSLDGKDQDFLIYPPNATDRSGEIDTAENNLKKVMEIRDMLNHILLGYMTQDRINFDPMQGCGVTNENIRVKLRTQETLDAVYANIINQFISMITPHLSNTTKLFRMIFPRQSKAKHYPVLRKRYLNEQPFMEPMEVPVAQSRLKFTDWEINNGFNTADRILASDPVDNTELATAASLFNGLGQ